jgi:hypothetical protein
MTEKSVQATVPFLVLGVVFFAIGARGNNAFIGLGLAFMAIYFAQVMRARKR